MTADGIGMRNSRIARETSMAMSDGDKSALSVCFEKNGARTPVSRRMPHTPAVQNVSVFPRK